MYEIFQKIDDIICEIEDFKKEINIKRNPQYGCVASWYEIEISTKERASFDEWCEENKKLINGFRDMFAEKISSLEKAYFNLQFERHLLSEYEKELKLVLQRNDQAKFNEFRLSEINKTKTA